jgi:hypothetical protein
VALLNNVILNVVTMPYLLHIARVLVAMRPDKLLLYDATKRRMASYAGPERRELISVEVRSVTANLPHETIEIYIKVENGREYNTDCSIVESSWQ